MRFTAIDTSAWEELKKSIEELALCMREHFGMKPELPDLLLCYRSFQNILSIFFKIQSCLKISVNYISTFTFVNTF